MSTKNTKNVKNLKNKAGFAQALIDWYGKNHRDLPWRNTQDAYAIWLSEVMLQQTQVVTVMDYYERFLKAFPTIQDLAKASEAQVLKMWEGLGYYARCRNLHQAAKQVVVEHQGRFPDCLEAVEALPGIGRSTAGAILTFAYGQKHPLLDGNVKRVLSRLYNLDEPIEKTSVQKQMWKNSAELLEPATDAYSFNQAIMELGATLCIPKMPACLLCPVEGFCEAKACGTQQERPVKTAKKAIPHHQIGAAVIWREDGRILIQQRPRDGLLGGLWEFPGGKQEPGETLEETVIREIREELAIEIEVGEKLVVVNHAYSHFKITLHAYVCQHISGEPQLLSADDLAWVRPDELRQHAFPKANNRVIDELETRIQDGRIIPETISTHLTLMERNK